MVRIQIIAAILSIMGSLQIFNFEPSSNLKNWNVVDDVVMGGRSNGSLKINADGHGVFSGYVSTENNGGFSSVRYNSGKLDVKGYTQAVLRLKGDGKYYQFRVKSDPYQRHAYVYEFQTTGDWETVIIPLDEMKPKFRGRDLDLPNYPADQLQEVAFLIGNKKNESFELLIDYIEFK